MQKKAKTKLAVAGSLALVAVCGSAQTVPEDELRFHTDYYLGFSHGAYYGLMLAGVDYHVAWCMKGELEYEAAGLGTGSEFQQAMDGMLAKCRAAAGQD
jgi:hypothetical protein